MDPGKSKKAITEENLKTVLRSIELIKYGSVTLIIQDGVVVQVEKNEKLRLV